MTRTWYLATVIVDDKIDNGINMFLRCWQFQWPWRSAGAIQSQLPNAASPGLLRKPLDAGIGQLLTPYHPSSRQGNCKQKQQQNITKRLDILMAAAVRRYNTARIAQ